MSKANKNNSAKSSKKRLVLASIVGVLVIIGAGSTWYHHHKTEQALQASARISAAPDIQSIPGAGNPSKQYVQTQVNQNQKQASKARKKGTSDVPTITRADFVGNPADFGNVSGDANKHQCNIRKVITMFKPNPANCTVKNLRLARSAGVTAEELTCQGCSCPALKLSGYTAGDLKAVGYTATELRKCGFSLGQLIEAGFNAKQLKAAGYTASQLADAGFSPEQLAQAGFTPKEIAAAGFTAKQLAALNKVDCSPAALRAAHDKGVPAAKLKGCGAAALKAAGYTAAELKKAGFTAGQLKAAGFTAGQLAAAGYTPEQLHAAGYTAADLKNAGFTPDQLRHAGYTKGDLLRAGYTPTQAGYKTQTAVQKAQKQGASALSQIAGPAANNSGASASMPSVGDNSAQAQLARLEQAQQAQMTAQQRNDAIQTMQGAMTMQAQKMLGEWNAHANQEMKKAAPEPTGAAPSAASLAAAQKAEQEANATIYKAGAIMFGVLNTSINTDENTPIMAHIVSGPLKGSKLIGQFNRVNKRVFIHFSLINIPRLRQSVPINAVAIDPDTASSAVGGQVNNHYLLRYGTMFASGFVQGLSDAIMQSNSTSQCSVFGCVTQSNKLNVPQQIAVGFGKVGQQYSDKLSDNFNRAPTVKIAGGTGIGVLVMSDLKVPKTN